ncbi:MAG: type II toxin-antitoxin system VapB family antitoxin [Acidobacteria bacterium]|nr:type II toxin-antitoxin system VapB family antitoxin [Acidobacteriota bacterium]
MKNAEVERLAEEVSRLAGESKTEAVRRALIERRARLRFALSGNNRATRFRCLLERDQRFRQ